MSRQMLNLPEDVRSYMKSKHGDNMSAYVTRLVRSDMSGDSLENRIKIIVEGILKNNSIPTNNSFDDSISDSVKNILDL